MPHPVALSMLVGLAIPAAAGGDASKTQTSAFRGVWYACGTANTLPDQKYVYTGGKGFYSTWHRPMAVYARPVNRTFFVFGDPQNRPCIASYDHAARRFSKPVALGRNPDRNAHRNPTLLIDERGHLFVFRGYNGMPTFVQRSRKPYDLGAWDERTCVETDKRASYPQPWQLRKGEIFVSYRHPPGWSCRITTDDANSWQPTVNLIDFGRGQIYAATTAETGDYPRRIHIAWSRLGGGTPREVETKHLWARRYNVYYARSDDGGRTWRRSDGRAYTLPIDEAQAEKIYDCGTHGVWLKDIQLDLQGRPIVLFVEADVATYRSQWKVARHDGKRWRLGDVAVSDHMYDGGALVVLADDDLRVYAPTTPTQPRRNGGEIEQWRSTDGGLTWRNALHVTTGSRYSHNHVKGVLNHRDGPGGLRVLWSYGDARYPPETRDVLLYYFGKGMDGARVMARSPDRSGQAGSARKDTRTSSEAQEDAAVE